MNIDLNCGNDVEIVRGYLRVAREDGRIIGLTSGCFDLLHFLHHYFLVRCRQHCDVLIVGVDSDSVVRASKGPSRPIVPDYQRVQMVDGLKAVSVAFVMNSVADFGRAAELFRPDFILKNQDYPEDVIVGREYATKGIITIDDVVSLDSTSAIIREVMRRSQMEIDDV
jgi:cytidyltransferase-like protein